MKKKIINIYTGNHILEFLIEDIVKIIKEIFSKNNFEVIVSRNDILLNGNNIFLELFYTKKHVENLQKIKKKFPNTKFILLLTENFPTKKLSQSCNDFNSNYLVIFITRIIIFFERIFIFFFQVTSFLKRLIGSRLFFSDKNKVNIKIKPIKLKNFKRLSILNFLISHLNIFEFVKNLQTQEINIKRYLFTKKLIKDFDCLLTIHPKITRLSKIFYGKDSFTLFPLANLNKLYLDDINKQTMISTGLQTEYRRTYISKMNKLLSDSEYSIKEAGFESKEFLKNYELNYNVHHNEAWPNSSAVRIIRSLWNNQIPIVAKKFNDHMVEKLSIELNEHNVKKINDLIKDHKKKIKKRINQYNLDVENMNQCFLNQIKNFKFKKKEQRFIKFYIYNHHCFDSEDLYFNCYFQGYSIFETKPLPGQKKQEKNYFAFNKKINTRIISQKKFNEFFVFKSTLLSSLKVRIYEDKILKSQDANEKVIYRHKFLSVIFYENCFHVVRNNLPNIKVQLNSVAKFPNLFLAINYIIRLFELKSKEVFKITI